MRASPVRVRYQAHGALVDDGAVAKFSHALHQCAAIHGSRWRVATLLDATGAASTTSAASASCRRLSTKSAGDGVEDGEHKVAGVKIGRRAFEWGQRQRDRVRAQVHGLCSARGWARSTRTIYT